MLARLYVLMPYTVTLSEGEQFPVYEAVEGEYTVRFLPPVRSTDLNNSSGPKNLTMDGKPAFEANVMRIDFQKGQFDRKIDGELDPPHDVIQSAVRWFHSRLRYVTRAAHAKPVSFPWNQWKLDYTNDDGSPLEESDGCHRGRGSIQFQWSFVGVTKQAWEHVFGLPSDFEIPVWDDLRLDAQAALPSVGAAVVLGAASLEVFISSILDRLSVHRDFSQELWQWINERGERKGNWLRQPTVEEQFDVLLKHFCGHSLKEESLLWEGFRNLKTARNTFVHEGIARLGGERLTKEQAKALLGNVNNIIAKIRDWVPEDVRWPEPKVRVDLSWTHALFEESTKGESDQE